LLSNNNKQKTANLHPCIISQSAIFLKNDEIDMKMHTDQTVSVHHHQILKRLKNFRSKPLDWTETSVKHLSTNAILMQ